MNYLLLKKGGGAWNVQMSLVYFTEKAVKSFHDMISEDSKAEQEKVAEGKEQIDILFLGKAHQWFF